jgi:hypothetical protein
MTIGPSDFNLLKQALGTHSHFMNFIGPLGILTRIETVVPPDASEHQRITEEEALCLAALSAASDAPGHIEANTEIDREAKIAALAILNNAIAGERLVTMLPDNQRIVSQTISVISARLGMDGFHEMVNASLAEFPTVPLAPHAEPHNSAQDKGPKLGAFDFLGLSKMALSDSFKEALNKALETGEAAVSKAVAGLQGHLGSTGAGSGFSLPNNPAFDAGQHPAVARFFSSEAQSSANPPPQPTPIPLPGDPALAKQIDSEYFVGIWKVADFDFIIDANMNFASRKISVLEGSRGTCSFHIEPNQNSYLILELEKIFPQYIYSLQYFGDLNQGAVKAKFSKNMPLLINSVKANEFSCEYQSLKMTFQRQRNIDIPLLMTKIDEFDLDMQDKESVFARNLATWNIGFDINRNLQGDIGNIINSRN